VLGDYVVGAAAAWFVGFFPLAEIYVAVPAAMAAGLDDVSAVIWPVLGNFTPVILIQLLDSWLMGFGRIRNWFARLYSGRFQRWIDRYGTWFIVLITPWIGVWAIAVTAKALGLRASRLLPATFVSILLYAIALVILIRSGLTVVGA
jgi:uncharacterized membrane protein